MKIIKRGIPSEDKVWLGTCTNCNSIIEATRRELKFDSFSRPGEDFGRADCPVCNKSMCFYEKDHGDAEVGGE